MCCGLTHEKGVDMWAIILGVCFGIILFHGLKNLFGWLNDNSESEPEVDLVNLIQEIRERVDRSKNKP